MASNRALFTSATLSSVLFAETRKRYFEKIPQAAWDELPHFGLLKTNETGLLYVDVDDDYIHRLISFIEKEGFEKPPYFGDDALVGAHITVGYLEPGQVIEDCGEIIFFTPIRCTRGSPPNWEEVEEVFVIDVEAPQLSEIQARHGLPKLDVPFHITIGVRRADSC